MRKDHSGRSACPISCSLDIWGDRWSLLIIRNMMLYNQHTYQEFLEAPEKIATNILANRLRMLEKAGLITKKRFPENKKKIFYKLTRMGIDLLPTMIEISFWGEKYFSIAPEAKVIVKSARNNRSGFIRTLAEKLEKQEPA